MASTLKPPTVENYQDLADSLPEYWHKHLNEALRDAYHRGRNDEVEELARITNLPTEHHE